jgi:DNA-binding NarL/FixJ family response regulator
LTEATVKTHVAQHIYRKLDLRDRDQAVVYAHEAGLVWTPADG